MAMKTGEMVAKAQTPKNPDVAGVRSHKLTRDGQGQLILDLGHDPSLIEADFVVGASNQMAFDRVIAYPEWSDAMTLITGAAKTGKSHLAGIWIGRSGAVVADAANLGQMAEADGDQPVLIEDADRVAYPEDALFHLLNQSMRNKRHVLLTARKAVQNWPYKTADVLSRARLAAHFEVEMPDDIQLSHMFVKLFGDRQISVDPKIIGYLVARMERSPEEVVALVELMDNLALARRVPVTRSIAAEALMLRTGDDKKEIGECDDE